MKGGGCGEEQVVQQNKGKEVKTLQTMPFMACTDSSPAVRQGSGPKQGTGQRNDIGSSQGAEQTAFSETLKNASRSAGETGKNKETARAAGNEPADIQQEETCSQEATGVQATEAAELIRQLMELLQKINPEVGWNNAGSGNGEQAGLQGGGSVQGSLNSLNGLLQGLNDLNSMDAGQLIKALGSLLKALEAAGDGSPGMKDLKLLIQNQLNSGTSLSRDVFMARFAAIIREMAGSSGQASPGNHQGLSGSSNTQPAGTQIPADTGGGQAQAADSRWENEVRTGSPAGAGGNNSGVTSKGNTDATAANTRENPSPGMPANGSGSTTAKSPRTTAPQSDPAVRNVSENQKGTFENTRPAHFSEPGTAGLRVEPQPQAQVGPQHQFSGNASSEGGNVTGQVSQTTQTYQGDRAVFTQIIQKVKVAASPGASEMEIELKPEFLGRLKLTVTADNGLVTARFNTHSPHVKAVIEANLQVLRDTLADQGIKVDQLTVTVTPEKNHSGQNEREGLFRRKNQTGGKRLSLNEEQIESVFSNGGGTLSTAGYFGNTVDFTA